MNYSTFTERVIGSARLDPKCYEVVEADRNSNLQAFAVVLLSNLAAGIGAGLQNVGGATAFLLASIASWIVWVLLTLLIGTQLLPGKETRADFGQVFRTTGFSASPGILRIFGLVPFIGGVVVLGATVWMLFSFVVAIRQALDYSNSGRALAVSLLGWLIHGVLIFGFEMTAM